MEFLKRNYMKLIIATLMLIGAIFMVIALATYKKDYVEAYTGDNLYHLGYLLTYLAGLSFFALSMATIIMKMFEPTRKYTKWVMLATAVVGTILMLAAISITAASDTSAELLKAIKKSDGEIANAVANGISASTGGAVAAADVPTSTIPLYTNGPTIGEYYAETYANSIFARNAARYQYFDRVGTLVSYFLVFGLLPLCFAVKKLICKCCKGEKKVEASPVTAAK